MAVFIPTYFSPIAQYAAMHQREEVVFEIEDNFQKQTYRNRCYIFGPNGKQLLNIPIKHQTTDSRKKTKDVLVDNSIPWQNQHLKSIKIAYNNSPFFEFYIDDLLPLFKRKYTYLLDVTIESYQLIQHALDELKTYKSTSEFQISIENDYRHLAIAKQKLNLSFPNYIQMFDDKFGFIENLSILDLLFMEGPNTLSILEKIKI